MSIDVHQTRIQGLNGEQWQGFTELFFQTTQEGFKSRRRIKTKESEAELQDKEVQQNLKEDMQHGLADKAMDFTPGKWFMG